MQHRVEGSQAPTCLSFLLRTSCRRPYRRRSPCCGGPHPPYCRPQGPTSPCVRNYREVAMGGWCHDAHLDKPHLKLCAASAHFKKAPTSLSIMYPLLNQKGTITVLTKKSATQLAFCEFPCIQPRIVFMTMASSGSTPGSAEGGSHGGSVRHTRSSTVYVSSTSLISRFICLSNPTSVPASHPCSYDQQLGNSLCARYSV